MYVRATRWVVAELDLNGEIDEHAAMCLRQSIDGVRAGAEVLVDLRDLSAIDPAAVAMFVKAHARCASTGVSLGLLIGGNARHDAIAAALRAAGLADQLRFTWEPASLSAGTGAAQARATRVAHTPRIRAAARRLSAAVLRRSGSA